MVNGITNRKTGMMGKPIGRRCSHPELRPTGWDQKRPATADMISHCDCGENYSCRVCGWGAGSYPCSCTRERMKNESPTRVIL